MSRSRRSPVNRHRKRGRPFGSVKKDSRHRSFVYCQACKEKRFSPLKKKAESKNKVLKKEKFVKPEPPPTPPTIHRKPSVDNPGGPKQPCYGPALPPKNIQPFAQPSNKRPQKPRPRKYHPKEKFTRRKYRKRIPRSEKKKFEECFPKKKDSRDVRGHSVCSHCGQILPNLQNLRSNHKSVSINSSKERIDTKNRHDEHYSSLKTNPQGSEWSGISEFVDKIPESDSRYLLAAFERSTLTFMAPENKLEDEISLGSLSDL